MPALIVSAIVAVILIGVPSCMFILPQYSPCRERGLAGKAELSQAQFNRQIRIQEAEATLEAAKHLANAEIEEPREPLKRIGFWVIR